MPDPTHFDKLASVAVQGGGVYGLALLGQLQAVIDRGYRVVALAGTSAGAIVATLYWAGVTPEAVRQELVKRAGPPNTVPHLLAGGKVTPQTVDRLLRAWARANKAKKKSGLAFAASAFTGLMELAWLRASGWAAGGLFPGDQFERFIDDALRASPRIKPHVDSGVLPKSGLLTFGHLWALTTDALAYFPALTLAATNLTTGGLELIDSTDAAYHALPVATAVRASGGFPGFFTPVPANVPDPNDRTRLIPCKLADGGVVCNFPSFVLSRWARIGQLGAHDRYRADVMRPWVNVGLRLDEPPAKGPVDTLPQVVGRVAGFLSGGGRAILEKRLTDDTVERFEGCDLPLAETGWPHGLLDFDRLTPTLVDAMFAAGRTFANRRLTPLDFSLPLPDEVNGWLEELVAAAGTAFGDPHNARWQFRASVFVAAEQKLTMLYRANYHTPADTDAGLQLAETDGAVGYCLYTRSGLLVNMGHFRGVVEPDGELSFGLHPAAQGVVRPDRSWLLCAPVFDPATANPDRLLDEPATDAVPGVYTRLPTPLDGGVFGVLALDAGFDYAAAEPGLSADPDYQLEDPRVQLVYDAVLAAAWNLGKLFAARFAVRPDPETL